jgi:group I intron endonuclease
VPSVGKLVTGAYCIRNLSNGKVYVGGAYKSFDHRCGLHLRDLRRGKHHNRHLQAAWNKYGESSFVFEILERCSPELVEMVEQWWIDSLKATSENGYNLSPTAGSTLGVKHSDQARQNMSVAHIGKSPSAEQRERMIASLRARGATPEFRAKMTVVNRETSLRPEVIENRRRMGEKRVGIPLTDEHKEKIRAAQVGKVIPEETRKKISDAQIGKVLTEEHRRNIGKALLGKKMSESRLAATRLAKSKLVGDKEFSEKMSEATRLGWVGRRAREKAKEVVPVEVVPLSCQRL